MSLCLQNLNEGGGNTIPPPTITGDRPTLMALAALVVLLHGGLAFWLGRAAVNPPLLKEKVIEIAMVSVAAPKSASKPAAAPTADKAVVKPAAKQPPPVAKAVTAKVAVPAVPKKPTPAKPKPVIKETLPTPVMPMPISPPLAAPPVSQATTHTDAVAAPPADTAKANPPTASTVAPDNSSASKASEGNPVACIDCPQPDYPAAARRRNMQGVVQLKLELSAEGKVVNVTVLQSSGHELLDEAAVADVREWQFAPGQQGVPRTATQRITFKM